MIDARTERLLSLLNGSKFLWLPTTLHLWRFSLRRESCWPEPPVRLAVLLQAIHLGLPVSERAHDLNRYARCVRFTFGPSQICSLDARCSPPVGVHTNLSTSAGRWQADKRVAPSLSRLSFVFYSLTFATRNSWSPCQNRNCTISVQRMRTSAIGRKLFRMNSLRRYCH